MAFMVRHREDRLLHRSVGGTLNEGEKDAVLVPDSFQAHQAVVAFLDAHLVGRLFNDQVAIQDVLQGWPTAFENALGATKRQTRNFSALVIVNDGRNIAFDETGNYQLYVATIDPA